MDKKGYGIFYLLGFVFIGIVGFSVYWFVLKDLGKDTKTATTSDGGVKIVENNNDSKNTGTDTTTESKDEGKTDDSTADNTDTTSTTDFSTFNSSKQTVGASANVNEYTLKSITDTKNDGYHKFVFLVQGKTSEVMDIPYVTVYYNSSAGSIRVDINGVTTDQSGIGYQKSRTINEQGIIKLYHNISSNPKEELYDIGLTKQTVYKLSSTEGSDNTWSIVVDVKYPGGVSEGGIIGSENFSKDLQALDGALKPDSPKVLSYSYSAVSGVLSIVFNVSGTTTRPFPSATAKYNSEGKLTLEFPQLISDAVYNSINGKKFSGIKINTVKSGEKYTYTFEGATKEFRLSASKSPNQVILEIKL